MLEITNLTKRQIPTKKIEYLVREFFIQTHNKRAELSLVFISDKKSQELNKKYRQKNEITDILSFPNFNYKVGSDFFIGEIFINLTELSRLKKYDELFSELRVFLRDSSRFFPKMLRHYPEEKEKASIYLQLFIITHGLLHLLAYTDEVEEKRQLMLETGYNFLEKVFKYKYKML